MAYEITLPVIDAQGRRGSRGLAAHYFAMGG